MILADGLKGTDEVEVPLPDGRHVKRVKIAGAIMDADTVISLDLFKGHERTGIGGALKNLGMGCGSRAGKMEMHSAGKPLVGRERCVGCHRCGKICAHDPGRFEEKKATINHDRCIGCGRRTGVCLADAISPRYDEALDIVQAKIAEYAAAVVRGRPCFHINMICEVSPYCDCHGGNDAAVIPDLGILAGFDPVALDKASAELCIAARRLPGTVVDGRENTGDLFHGIHPASSWRRAIEEGRG